MTARQPITTRVVLIYAAGFIALIVALYVVAQPLHDFLTRVWGGGV